MGLGFSLALEVLTKDAPLPLLLEEDSAKPYGGYYVLRCN